VTEGVRFIFKAYFGDRQIAWVRYRERPHTLVVTVRFKHPVDCGGCSYPSGGTPIRGTQATLTLDARTHHELEFAVAWP
jgi:hypothetical protein